MAHDNREGRDDAGIGPYAREREGLVSLSSLGAWKVSDGEPDIRGWEVHTVSGRQLGSVADLLVDATAGEVVMVDVDLPGSDRHSLVPIRVVQIDRARRMILMDSADLPQTSEVRVVGPAVTETRSVETRTIRYPRGDREVVVGRIGLPGDMRPADEVAAVERRRAERRRIERVSTDL